MRQFTRRFDLLLIMIADFVARTAYQMGKTPLLPIFALTLGATDLYLGFIVSVSTLTGIVLKPIIGAFSDRAGRRRWLLIGAAVFILMPFTYRFIETPEQLLVIRLIHGLATAIFGPVTLAYVIEQAHDNSAERLGWFSIARSGGYIFGPLLAGAFLKFMDAIDVFTLMGIFSLFILIPLLALPQSQKFERTRTPLWSNMHEAAKLIARKPSIWLAGSVEAFMYIATYTLKTFLPIYALSIGLDVLIVGFFFSLQELVTIVAKPIVGKFADRIGYLTVTMIGLTGVGTSLIIVSPLATHAVAVLIPSVLIGVSQALISTAVIAYVGDQVHRQYLGVSLGFVGAMDNGGKVLGPILAGMLLTYVTFPIATNILGSMLLCAVIIYFVLSHFLWHGRPRSNGRSTQKSSFDSHTSQ